VISRFFAEIGEVALAARAYAGTLASVPSLLGIALGWGAQIRVSYLLGAGQETEARQEVLRSCRLTVVLAPLFSLLIFLNAGRLLTLFTEDPAVTTASTLLLGCFILLEIGRSCNTTIAPALKARGEAGYVARTAFVIMLPVCLPIAWIVSFPLGLGILGLGLVAALDEMLRGWLNLKRWQK
jgi:Na+-driven multidrug efflux pump